METLTGCLQPAFVRLAARHLFRLVYGFIKLSSGLLTGWSTTHSLSQWACWLARSQNSRNCALSKDLSSFSPTSKLPPQLAEIRLASLLSRSDAKIDDTDWILWYSNKSLVVASHSWKNFYPLNIRNWIFASLKCEYINSLPGKRRDKRVCNYNLQFRSSG